MACLPKSGLLKRPDSCKITPGGSKSENKKIFGGAGISDSKNREVFRNGRGLSIDY